MCFQALKVTHNYLFEFLYSKFKLSECLKSRYRKIRDFPIFYQSNGTGKSKFNPNSFGTLKIYFTYSNHSKANAISSEYPRDEINNVSQREGCDDNNMAVEVCQLIFQKTCHCIMVKIMKNPHLCGEMKPNDHKRHYELPIVDGV